MMSLHLVLTATYDQVHGSIPISQASRWRLSWAEFFAGYTVGEFESNSVSFVTPSVLSVLSGEGLGCLPHNQRLLSHGGDTVRPDLCSWDLKATEEMSHKLDTVSFFRRGGIGGEMKSRNDFFLPQKNRSSPEWRLLASSRVVMVGRKDGLAIMKGAWLRDVRSQGAEARALWRAE